MSDAAQDLTIEINMVTSSAIDAAKVYAEVFGAEITLSTNEPQGLNEAFLKLHGLQIHILDENPDYMLIAPQKGEASPMWINQKVNDIAFVVAQAEKNNFTIIQPPTEIENMAMVNAVVKCPFGFIWILHQNS